MRIMRYRVVKWRAHNWIIGKHAAELGLELKSIRIQNMNFYSLLPGDSFLHTLWKSSFSFLLPSQYQKYDLYVINNPSKKLWVMEIEYIIYDLNKDNLNFFLWILQFNFL